MRNFWGTTAVIEETRRSNSGFLFMKRKGIASILFNCLLIYFVGSLLSGLLLSIPTYISISQSDAFAELLSNPDNLANDDIINRINESLPTWLNSCSLIATLGMIFAVLFYSIKFEGKRLFSLGIIKKGAVSDYLCGLLIGALMFSLSFLLIIASGETSLPTFNADVNWGIILLFFVGFLIQGFSEEVLVRGYLFVSVASNKNVPFAVFISSIFFSLLHYANAGINVLGLINLFLFGVFASLYFLRRGSIWGIAAIHSTWNFMQGNFFGCSVSGNAGLDSIFNTVKEGSSVLFNGGDFGPEGGLGVTIILVVAIAILLPLKNKEIEVPLAKNGNEFYSA